KTLQDGLPVPAEIVLGENSPELGPVLFTGERLGPDGEPQLLLALDPLEGTTLCARGEPGAITVAAGALAGQGQLMGNVDGYFDKIIVGKDLAKRVLSMKETGGPYFYVKVNET